MADVVNLRRFRKARRQSGKDEAAGRNRALFGRSKAEREAAESAAQRSARHLDEHRREPAPSPGTEPDA